MKAWKIILLAGALAVPSYAQSAGEQQEGEEAVGGRPDMPALFFRQEQRRVLEAVRQGVVEEDDFSIDEFVPVVITQQPLSAALLGGEVDEQPIRERQQDFYFNAYIVNRSNGKSLLWLNGEEVDVVKDANLLARQGIYAPSEEEQLGIGSGALYGSDAFSNSRFQVKVGQVIGVDGTVEETLPVVRIHKK